MASLEKIACKELRLGKLTPAEQRLLAEGCSGAFVWCGTSPDYWDHSNDPKNADDGATRWGPERNIRARLINWLVSNPYVTGHISAGGVHLGGARIIEGRLELSHLTIRFPLVLVRCRIRGGIELFCSRVLSLDLAGSLIEPLVGSPLAEDGAVSIAAVRLTADGNILMGSGFSAGGEINLTESRINGDLDCAGGQFGNGHNAISASGAQFGRNVLLGSRPRARGKHVDLFEARGQVTLSAAQIGGNLDCRGGRFELPPTSQDRAKALKASNVEVEGSILLGASEAEPKYSFRATGGVDLDEAEVEGDLNCGGGCFQSDTGASLVSRGARVNGSAFLNEGFVANGEVNLAGAEIRGSLDCTAGTFKALANGAGMALRAEGVRVAGRVSMRAAQNHPFQAFGAVSLVGAQIGGSLECTAGRFDNAQGDALNAARIRIGDKLFLDSGFIAKGEVSLRAAQINGSVVCAGGYFENANDCAIRAHLVKIGGSLGLGDDLDASPSCRPVWSNGAFEANGEINLIGASIGGFFWCENARFQKKVRARLLTVRADASFKDAKFAGPVELPNSIIGGSIDLQNAQLQGLLDLHSAKIEGSLNCQGANLDSAEVDLRQARAGTLEDDESTLWPSGCGKLKINGFAYDNIHSRRFTTKRGALTWLRSGAQSLSGASEVASPARTGYNAREPNKNVSTRSRLEYKPQPFKQMAAILSKMGHEKLAKEILIEKERSRSISLKHVWVSLDAASSCKGREGRNRWYALKNFLTNIVRILVLPFRCLWWAYMLSVGFWYKPLRALALFAALVIFGAMLSEWGHEAGFITPNEFEAHHYFVERCHSPEHYEEFNSLIYSIETALPFVNLRQKEKWAPHSDAVVCLQPDQSEDAVAGLVKVNDQSRLGSVGALAPEPKSYLALAPKSQFQPRANVSRWRVLLLPFFSEQYNRWISLPACFGRTLRWYLWVQTILGWVLAATFIAGVSGLVHDKGESVRDHAE